MPQLDLLLFKYETITFLLSFFALFFINQYYIFPNLLKNIILRRKLLSRTILGSNNIFFCLLFLRKYKVETAFNMFFTTSLIDIRNLYVEYKFFVFGLLNLLFQLKYSDYFRILDNFKHKIILVLGLAFKRFALYL